MQRTYCCRWRFFPHRRYSLWPRQFGPVRILQADPEIQPWPKRRASVAEWQIGKLEDPAGAVRASTECAVKCCISCAANRDPPGGEAPRLVIDVRSRGIQRSQLVVGIVGCRLSQPNWYLHSGDDRSGHAFRDRQHRLPAGHHLPSRQYRLQRDKGRGEGAGVTHAPYVGGDRRGRRPRRRVTGCSVAAGLGSGAAGRPSPSSLASVVHLRSSNPASVPGPCQRDPSRSCLPAVDHLDRPTVQPVGPAARTG
jgi:hypothetical protein